MPSSSRFWSPNVASLVAALLALPMLVLLAAGILNIEPTQAFLKTLLTTDGLEPNALGFAYMLVGLLFLPVAFFIDVWPLFEGWKIQRRDFYISNMIIAFVIIGLVVATWKAFAA